MSVFSRLIGYARPYTGRFVAAVAAMLFYAAASAGLVVLIQPILDKALPKQVDLKFWAVAILVVYFFKGVGAYFSAYLMTDIGQRVVRDLRNELFQHILGQSAGFFSRRATGQLMSRITNDVTQVQLVVSETVGDLLREGLALIGFAGALFYYDYKLALVCVTGAPIVVYPIVRLGQRVRRTSRRSQEQLEHLSHITAEAFTGHRIVKAFGAESHETRRFQDASERLYRTNLKVTSTVSLLPPIMEFLGGVAIAGLILYGSRQIADERMTQGSFLAFVFAALMMYTPIKKLSRVNTNLQQAMAASERIFEMLDTHSEVRERPGASVLAPLRYQIEYRNVSFAYEDGSGKYVLRDVSFSVRAGQMIAIVGLSGAGKTSLVNLIPRFFDVTSGAILIDGVDIRDVTLKSLRAQVGHRHPGDGAVRRERGEQHRVRLVRRVADRDRGCRARGARARIHHGDARGVRHVDRRAWPAAVRGPAAAARDCQGALEELADAHPGRSDFVSRFRIGAARAGGAGQPHAQPHVLRDRAPAVHRQARRFDRDARAGPRR